jgi:ferric-dicitrate binding protein FerR (iron transport regulator)
VAVLAPIALAAVAHIGEARGSGTIALRDGRQIALQINVPVLAGDAIVTRAGARADVQLDDRVSVRLAEDTTVRVGDLTPHRRDVRLLAGTIAVSARAGGDAPRIETKNGAFGPDSPGLFRISVAGGTTSVVALSGTLRIITPGGMQILSPGERVEVEGPAM